MHLLFRLGAILLLAICGSGAMAVTPTAQQLQMFNSLSPAEQQQVLKAMGQQGATAFTSQKESQVKSAEEKKQPTDQLDEELLKQQQLEDEKRFSGGDTLIVRYIAKADLVPDGENKAEIILPGSFKPEREQELYVLDKYGVLNMPYAPAIALAGLDEEQAAARLALEPVFEDYLLTVTKLPLRPQGKQALKPFGYEIFRADEEGMDDDVALQIPVPADYVIGPGDTINIQLFGKENQFYELQVSREGSLLFPSVGAISVAGLSFSELKRDLNKRIQKQFIGVEAQISMGELRSIHVFVTGEVAKPGSYFVGALSSMTHVLTVAGGINEIGSMRKVALKRKGKLVQELDLYELLLQGNTANDLRLQAGDVVHVPAVDKVVSIVGEVRRPAIYELRGQESLKQLVELAGGLTADAFALALRVERVGKADARKVLTVGMEQAATTKLKDGDFVEVNPIAPRMDQYVLVSGLVDRPGRYQWTKDLRLSQVLGSRGQLDPQTDFDYALVKRYDQDNRLRVLSLNLATALDHPGSSDDVVLQPRDEVVLFSRGQNRQFEVSRIVDQLRKQAEADEPAQLVRIHGQVHSPGDYPLTPSMTVADLLQAGGMLKDSAYVLEAELTRFTIDPQKGREIAHRKIDLQAVLKGDSSANIQLQSYDLLTIKEIPLWEERDSVEVVGEVRFPGRYAIRRGETLSELIKRAGGFTDYAYIKGAVFMREELRQREQKQLDTMAANLEAELAAVALQRSGDVSQISTAGMANDLLGKLRQVKAAGRLVIHLDEVKLALEQGKELDAEHDIVLQGGDKLFIPGQMQEVTVLGEVFHPTSHLYKSGISVEDYLEASGGMTNKADSDSVYVIKANGSVQLAKRSWLDPQVNLSPGDTIIVPFDSEKVSSLKLWTDVSQIVYQLGLSVAAWKNVGLLTL